MSEQGTLTKSEPKAPLNTFWDRLPLILSVIQIVFLGTITAMTGFYSANQKGKNDWAIHGLSETKMIQDLLLGLSSDSTKGIKTDFAFLALHRYLISSNDGELTEYDNELLCGFSEAIILDRIKNSTVLDSINQNDLLVPLEYLEKHDSLRLPKLFEQVKRENFKKVPAKKIETTQALKVIEPITQLSGSNEALIQTVLKQTIYIQYNDPAKRERLTSESNRFNRFGWSTSTPEYVPGKYGQVIKYFHQEDVDLVQLVANALDGTFQYVYVPAYQNKVPKGQIEIWVGKGDFPKHPPLTY